MIQINYEQQKGFTLLELMLVVAIVAVLASVALPAYSGYIVKANRADAQGVMGTLLLDEEKYFATNLSYTTALGSTGLQYNTETAGTPTGAGVFPDSRSYKFTLTACGGTPQPSLTACVRVLATAQPKQADDEDCQFMYIQSDGAKDSSKTNAFSTANSTKATCWKE